MGSTRIFTIKAAAFAAAICLMLSATQAASPPAIPPVAVPGTPNICTGTSQEVMACQDICPFPYCLGTFFGGINVAGAIGTIQSINSSIHTSISSIQNRINSLKNYAPGASMITQLNQLDANSQAMGTNLINALKNGMAADTIDPAKNLLNNLGGLSNMLDNLGKAPVTFPGCPAQASNYTNELNVLQQNLSPLNAAMSGFNNGGLIPTAPMLSNINSQLATVNSDGSTQDFKSSTATLASFTNSSSNINALNKEGAKNGVPNLGTNVKSNVATLVSISSSMSSMNGTLDTLINQTTTAMSKADPATAKQLDTMMGNITGLSNTMISMGRNYDALNSDLNCIVNNPSSIVASDIAQVNAEVNVMQNFNNQMGNISNLNNILLSMNPTSLVNLNSLTNLNASLSQLTSGLGNISSLSSIAIGNSAANVFSNLMGTLGQDNAYKDMQIKGPVKPIDNTVPPKFFYSSGSQPDPGLLGVMPSIVMPNKNTPAISLVQNFPWLWKSIGDDETSQSFLPPAPSDNDASDNAKARAAVYSQQGNNTYADVDTCAPSSASDINDSEGTNTSANSPTAIGNSGKYGLDSNKCMLLKESCPVTKTNTLPPGSPDINNIARWKRLQADNYANQYILPLSLNPAFVFFETYREHQYPYNETFCQPLWHANVSCVPDLFNKGNCKKDLGSSDGNMYDYRAWGYLELAWRNILDNTPGSAVAGTVGFLPNGGGTNTSSYPIYGNPPVLAVASNSTTPQPAMIIAPGITGEIAFGPLDKNIMTSGYSPAANSGYSPGYGTQKGETYGVDTSQNNGWGVGAQYLHQTQSMYSVLPPLKQKLITVNDLAQVPVERIWDPTHPYSPRWDFRGTDRDWSNSAQLKLIPPFPIVDYNWQGVTKNPDPYSKNIVDPTLNGDPGYDEMGIASDLTTIATGTNIGGCIVRCAAVPVDILSFRSQEFAACMGCRIKVNEDCFWSQVAWYETPWAFVDFYLYVPFTPCTPCIETYHFNGEDPLTAESNTITDTPTGNADESETGSPGWFTPGVGIAVRKAISAVGLGMDTIHFAHLFSGDIFNSFLDNTLSCKLDHSRNNQWPLCSTKFDHPHDLFTGSVTLGLSPVWTHTEQCSTCTTASGDPDEGNGVKKCCSDLAQALVPINGLKIRNTSLDPSLNPTPEGYSFKEYFGDHMPYMRWWDTTQAAGGTLDTTLNYDPNCNLGQYDTIVGVGTEGKGGKYCRYGGNGEAVDDQGNPLYDTTPCTVDPATGIIAASGNPPVPCTPNPPCTLLSSGKPNPSTCTLLKPSYKCIPLDTPDALTSWTELKMYQMHFARQYGLNCIGQYEKLDKEWGAEDGALNATGGYFSFAFTKVDSNHRTPWPLGWRGYLSDPDLLAQFPSFGSTPGSPAAAYPAKGLDNAQKGDIIYLTHADVAPTVPGVSVMPFIAVVTEASHGNLDPCADYIIVQDINNGKSPDACGNTDRLGLGSPRTIFKEQLQQTDYEAYYPAGSIHTDSCGVSYQVQVGNKPPAINNSLNCSDPYLKDCTFYTPGQPNLWNSIRIYRPTLDVRVPPADITPAVTPPPSR